MRVLSDLVRNIVVIILLTTFLDMILPSSNMKRYVKVVLGVFVLLTVLSPLSSLLKTGEELTVFDWHESEEKADYVSLLADSNSLSGVNQELLWNNYARGLEQQIVALVKLVQGVDSAQAKVTLQVGEDGKLQGIDQVSIKVSLGKNEAENEAEEIGSYLVEPVKIEVSLQGDKSKSGDTKAESTKGESAKVEASEDEASEDEASDHKALNVVEKNVEGEIKKTIAQYLGIKPKQISVTFSA